MAERAIECQKLEAASNKDRVGATSEHVGTKGCSDK